MHRFNNDQSIYIQMMNIIKQQIINGTFKENDKVSSVRELAVEYGINPNTVQKALSALEQEGFIETHRTVGRYVSLPKETLKEMKNDMATTAVNRFIKEVRDLNYNNQEIIELLEKTLKKERKTK